MVVTEADTNQTGGLYSPDGRGRIRRQRNVRFLICYMNRQVYIIKLFPSSQVSGKF